MSKKKIIVWASSLVVLAGVILGVRHMTASPSAENSNNQEAVLTPTGSQNENSNEILPSTSIPKGELSYLEESGITIDMLSKFIIKEDKAHMSGIINADTPRQIKELLDKYPKVKTIVMETVDGSVDDEANLKASKLVRGAGLNTHLADNGAIASGGTDFFCAGVTRTVGKNVQIGVHSWAGGDNEVAAALPRDHKAHKMYIDYYKEMTLPLPEEFYFFTLNAAPAEGMHYMTAEEIEKYGLTTETVSAQPAKVAVSDAEKPDLRTAPQITNDHYTPYVDKHTIIGDTTPLGGAASKYYSKYIDYIAPNGKPIRLLAQDQITNSQLLYAYAVLEFYLTNLKDDVANRMGTMKQF